MSVFDPLFSSMEELYRSEEPMTKRERQLADYRRENPPAPLKSCISDHCETDTYIRQSAARVLPEYDVYGSPEGVPPLEYVVDRLVEIIQPERATGLDIDT